MTNGNIETHRPPSLIALAAGLWVLSSALSLILIPATIDIVTRIYAAFWADYDRYGQTYWGGVAIRQLLLLPLAVLAVAVIIGGAEFHIRHAATRKSWLCFTYTLAAELGLLMMSWLI